MRITALAVLALVAGTGANAAERVQICTDNNGDIYTNARARNIATQMFAGIGVATFGLRAMATGARVGAASVTVRFTAAALELARPSEAVQLKVSAPVYPALGV